MTPQPDHSAADIRKVMYKNKLIMADGLLQEIISSEPMLQAEDKLSKKSS